MNLKKEIISLIFEIIVCFCVIILGMYYWLNCDRTSLETAKHFSNYNKIVVNLSENNTVLSNDEKEVLPNILYLKNNTNKSKTAKLVVKIDKDNTLFRSNTIIKIDNIYYDLNNLDYKVDDKYNYIFINNITLNSYETKELEVKLLTKESIKNNIYKYLSYEFVTQV